MKKYIVLLACVFICSVFFRCSDAQHDSDKIFVGASIAPLADFVERIGGSKVEVFTVVPAGTNPHSFELTPGLMKKMNSADLLVFNGVGLEYWIDNVRDNLSMSEMTFAADGLEIIAEDEHHHAEGNPHVWLNPKHAIYMVERVNSALQKVDAENSEYYQKNAVLFIKELSDLDRDIQTAVASWRQKKFVCFHPAWAYFAERYGLEQAGVIEERHGMQPSPGDVAEIIETVETIGARVIFAEAQFPSQIAEIIASESGIAVVPLDPLGSQDQKGYVELMRYNVAQMSKGMK